MFNVYLLIYVVVAIVSVGGGGYYLFSNRQSTSGVLYLIGSIAVFTVYGMKWFSENSLFAQTPGPWPPNINTCPDYLTYYKRTTDDVSKQNTCIDMIGVSKNGGLIKFPSDGTIPTTDSHYFNLMSPITNPLLHRSELCALAISKGLTWEGITNGEGCASSSGSTVATAGCASNA